LIEWKYLAENGNTSFQYNLGLMYENGKGVPQNFEIAIKWYTLAAEQGVARAQYNLGVLYKSGTGTSRDIPRAHKWLNITATQGHKGAKKLREKIEKKMTPAQLENAERLFRECVEKKYKGC